MASEHVGAFTRLAPESLLTLHATKEGRSAARDWARNRKGTRAKDTIGNQVIQYVQVGVIHKVGILALQASM